MQVKAEKLERVLQFVIPTVPWKKQCTTQDHWGSIRVGHKAARESRTVGKSLDCVFYGKKHVR